MLATLLGIGSGFILGISNGLGAVFITPLIVFATGMPVHNAIILTSALIGSTAVLTLLAKSKQKHFDWQIAFYLTLGSVLAAPAGAKFGESLSEKTLLLSFAIFCFAAVVLFISDKAALISQQRKTLHHPRPPHLKTIWPKLFLVGIGAGFIIAIFGIGGGFLVMPLISQICSQPYKRMMPIALLMIVPTTIVSLAVHLQQHAFNLPLTLSFLIGSMLGIWLSAILKSSKAQQSLLRPALLLFMMCTLIMLSARQLPPNFQPSIILAKLMPNTHNITARSQSESRG